MINNSFEKYQNIKSKNSSILCVGLDSDISKMPSHIERSTEGLIKFNLGIIEATEDFASAYKINFAFYEQYGIDGIYALKKTIGLIPKDIFIIADAKRGDIGNTSKSYASACFEYYGCDAVTVNPYMGYDSVMPFLSFKDRMTFLLALTSNPGSEDFQRMLFDDKPLYMHVINRSLMWAELENLGFVVGATHPGELRSIRGMIPRHLVLIPGVGAQGGDVKAVIESNLGGNALINVSRDIIYTSDSLDYQNAVRERAKYYRDLFNI